MANFNDFINNLIDYNSSITQGTVRPLFTEEPYDGKDLSDLITKSGDKTNPKIVAALEAVQGYRRAHLARTRTPKNYAANQSLIVKKREQYYKKILLPEFNTASGAK